jgi:hypothetical protein
VGRVDLAEVVGKPAGELTLVEAPEVILGGELREDAV